MCNTLNQFIAPPEEEGVVVQQHQEIEVPILPHRVEGEQLLDNSKISLFLGVKLLFEKVDGRVDTFLKRYCG